MPRIASASAPRGPRWHKVFLAILPRIVNHARVAFRHLKGEARQDAIQEVVANSLVAFVALVRRGKMSLAYPTPLAKFAVAQYADGRRVGNSMNVRDVSSEYAKKAKGIRLERLDHYDNVEECWNEVLIEDKTTTPAELAATRIDFRAWLNQLSCRDRKIARFLSLGNRTQDAAHKFGLSEGRVSQLRRELAGNWKAFINEAENNRPAAA